MQIVTFRPGTPPEPTRFIRRLHRLPPERSAITLARAVSDVLRDRDFDYEQTKDLGPLTVHMMQRDLLLRSGEPSPVIPRDAKARDLKYFLRQYLAIRDTLPAFVRQPTEAHAERVTRILWRTALEQELLSANVKIEMARAWLMYETVWPDLVRAGTIKIRPGLGPTAIGAVHNALLFLIGIWNARGYIPDPASYFSTTALGSQMSLLLRQFATAVADLKPVLADARLPPNAFRNIFAEHPLVSLPDGGLLAPDPAVIFLAFERGLLNHLLRDFIEEGGQGGFDAVSRAFGFVFEEYGRRIIHAATNLGGRYLPEFKYRSGREEVASPDAFVLSHGKNLVIEFKATRYPRDATTLLSDPIGHLWQWLSKLLGATANRAALTQGMEFFARAGGLHPLENHDVSQGLYLVCNYSRIPAMLNHQHWRRQCLASRRELAVPLFDRTAFVSIADIEIASTAAGVFGNPSFVDLVFEWWNATFLARSVVDACTLGDYALRRYPNTVSHELPLLSDARAELFAAASTAAFGDPMKMPKNWWLVRNEAD